MAGEQVDGLLVVEAVDELEARADDAEIGRIFHAQILEWQGDDEEVVFRLEAVERVVVDVVGRQVGLGQHEAVDFLARVEIDRGGDGFVAGKVRRGAIEFSAGAVKRNEERRVSEVEEQHGWRGK